ncbi:MAG: ImmA/IrrE family metallo-endopeptidase [Coprobacillus sp.]|nr:ImmA/IrrE family metallo-endopeptidase [Coprobacillus sp.]
METPYFLDLVCDIYEETGINRLGFNNIDVCKKLGIKVITYSYIRNSDQELCNHIMEKNKDGFSTIYENTQCIIYNDEVRPKGRITQTINHELGHIILGHHLTRKNIPEDQMESEANLFASMFYTPFILMVHYSILTVDQICKVFHITRTNAKIQHERVWNKIQDGEYHANEKEFKLLEIFQNNQEITIKLDDFSDIL